MDDSLFSFAKFLEALAYSPTICTITPALCEHTTPPPLPWPPSDLPLPKSRLNIIRYFSYRSRVVSVSLSEIEDIFEIRVPRLQIINSGTRNEPSSLPAQVRMIDDGEEKRALRREMMSWWRGISEYIDTLVRLSSKLTKF
jgi:1-phosphatidylinositol-3-phosphate 5-kinase